MEKLDNTAEEEAIKVEARQFLADIVPAAAAAPEVDSFPTCSARGADILQTWKATYNASYPMTMLMMEEQFWSIYDSNAISIWAMVYDYADSNESLPQTISLVESFLKEEGMQSIQDQCFGIVHILENLEIEGLWFFNGPDPTPLFGSNESSSWYSWRQLGPDATDLVKKVVASFVVPTDQTLNGTTIKNTQVFC